MKNLLVGFVMGLLLSGTIGSAQTADNFAPTLPPPLPYYGGVMPFGVPFVPLVPSYPPAYQSLPPMPTPHWQSPC